MNSADLLRQTERLLQHSSLEDSESYEELCSCITQHQRLYYLEDAPLISDTDFDRLWQLLLQTEKDHPAFSTEGSPSQRVATRVLSELTKVQHSQPMLSLQNAFSEEELTTWHDRLLLALQKEDATLTQESLTYRAEMKFDGLAVSLRYEHGHLFRATTRGDGTTGEDITHNVLHLHSIPLSVPAWSELPAVEVRGEVVMTHQEFESLNQERLLQGEKTFANPRNAAAGSLRQLDSRVSSRRSMTFYAFSLMGEGFQSLDLSLLISQLQEEGFLTSPQSLSQGSLEQVLQFLQQNEIWRRQADFESDGVVIKLESARLRDLAGFTSHHPRWAIAYKYPAEQAESLLQAITLQVGRTGVITPVGELQPVLLSGALIRRATLHNFEELSEKDFRVGDTVLIERAGEVIPRIIRPVLEKRPTRSRPYDLPEYCPSCGTPLVQEEDMVALRCPNTTHCPAQVKGRILYMVSKPCLDIDHLGAERIEKLLSYKLISKVTDLWRLKPQEIMRIPLIREKAAQNILSALDAARSQPAWRLLTGLGIPLVGQKTAKTLLRAYGSIDAIMQASEEDMSSVHDIGQKVAHEVASFFSSSLEQDLMEEFRELGFSFEAQSQDQRETPLTRKKVVITGTLPSLSRQQAKDLLERAGASVIGSVSQKTDFVLLGADPGSKWEKAQSLGIPPLSEAELLDLSGEGSTPALTPPPQSSESPTSQSSLF